MESVKTALFLGTTLSGYWWFINRSFGCTIYIKKGSLHKAYIGEQLIGYSEKPYYSVNNGMLYSTFSMGKNTYTTLKRIREVVVC